MDVTTHGNVSAQRVQLEHVQSCVPMCVHRCMCACVPVCTHSCICACVPVRVPVCVPVSERDLVEELPEEGGQDVLGCVLVLLLPGGHGTALARLRLRVLRVGPAPALLGP